MSLYITHGPGGIYRTESYVKVEPVYLSPNRNWLIFKRDGLYLIENNHTGHAQTATRTKFGLIYENPLRVPAYVRDALRKLAQSI